MISQELRTTFRMEKEAKQLLVEFQEELNETLALQNVNDKLKSNLSKHATLGRIVNVLIYKCLNDLGVDDFKEKV